MADQSTLYQRLGGREAIEAVVDAFYERVLADEQLASYFEDTDVAKLRSHQRAFISAVTGGPGEGRDVREAHAHLDLTTADFDAVTEHLDAVLQEFDVGEKDREAVLAKVVSLEDDILADGDG